MSQSKKYISVDNANIEMLRRYFCCAAIEIEPEELYNTTHSDFFMRYGIANLIKNHYLLSELYQIGLQPAMRNVLEFGSGSGMFTLASLLWHSETREKAPGHEKIVMVDGASRTLKFFEDIWSKVNVAKKKDFDIEIVPRMSKGAFPKNMPNPDMIVFSNSLSEMLRDPRVDKEQLFDNIVQSQAVVFIIDYLYENTMEHLQEFTRGLESHYRSIHFYNWPTWNNFFQMVDLNKIEYSFETNNDVNEHRITPNVKFIKAILVPKKTETTMAKPLSSKLVNNYKYAWEHHDVGVLKKLFAENAIYHEKPERTPFVGIGDICNYWNRNAQQQEKVSFDPLFIRDEDCLIDCLWAANFYRIDLHKQLSLNGKFSAHADGDERIDYFRENYDKNMEIGDNFREQKRRSVEELKWRNGKSFDHGKLESLIEK